MTHSYVRRRSILWDDIHWCLTWHSRVMWLSQMWRDTFMCDVNHLYAKRDDCFLWRYSFSFIWDSLIPPCRIPCDVTHWCMMLLIDVSRVTHPHKRWVSVLCDVTLRICRDIHGGTPSFPYSILCDIIRECMMLLIDVSRDWITCETTQHSVWHYSLMYAITHTHVWRRSILCAITHWGMTWRWCVTGLSQVWRDTFKRDVHHLNVKLLGILCDVTLHIHACMGWLRLVGSP